MASQYPMKGSESCEGAGLPPSLLQLADLMAVDVGWSFATVYCSGVRGGGGGDL